MPPAQGGLGQAWFVLDFEAAWEGTPPPQGGLGQSWFVLDFEAAYGEEGKVRPTGIASGEAFGISTLLPEGETTEVDVSRGIIGRLRRKLKVQKRVLKPYRTRLPGSVTGFRPKVPEDIPDEPIPVMFLLGGKVQGTRTLVFSLAGERKHGQRAARIYAEEEDFFAIFNLSD